MWEVYEHKRVTRKIGALPVPVLKRYEKWKDVVMLSGQPGLQAIKGFHDEALPGQWDGYRSSRLGDRYRVIYKIEATEILVFVVDLTAHDYRRR